MGLQGVFLECHEQTAAHVVFSYADLCSWLSTLINVGKTYGAKCIDLRAGVWEGLVMVFTRRTQLC